MFSREEPRRPSVANRAAWLLASPLCASMAVGGFMLIANGAAGDRVGTSWALWILVAPSIPLYLLLLPLFPFLLRALRRGWAPAPLTVVAATLGSTAAFDLAFWLARP